MENLVIQPKNLALLTAGVLFVLNLIWIAARKPLRFLLAANLFGFYLAALISLTILPFPLSAFKQPLPESIFIPVKTNLFPFDMGRYGSMSPRLNQIDILNILAFLPFGFLLPFTTQKGKLPILLYALLATLIIETSQLLLSVRVTTYSRVFDVTDILTNTFGAWVGYLLSRPFFLTKKDKPQQD
ncbi:MAG: VanZ family protein [Anaerolineaceae bacterium]|nr:VanZ family protein [Anaerolineaceae bacterium]